LRLALAKLRRSYLQQKMQTKSLGIMAQIIGHFPSIRELGRPLGLISCIAKKKKKKKEEKKKKIKILSTA
jgi:hypothetical protein